MLFTSTNTKNSHNDRNADNTGDATTTRRRKNKVSSQIDRYLTEDNDRRTARSKYPESMRPESIRTNIPFTQVDLSHNDTSIASSVEKDASDVVERDINIRSVSKKISRMLYDIITPQSSRYPKSDYNSNNRITTPGNEFESDTHVQSNGSRTDRQFEYQRHSNKYVSPSDLDKINHYERVSKILSSSQKKVVRSPPQVSIDSFDREPSHRDRLLNQQLPITHEDNRQNQLSITRTPEYDLIRHNSPYKSHENSTHSKTSRSGKERHSAQQTNEVVADERYLHKNDVNSHHSSASRHQIYRNSPSPHILNPKTSRSPSPTPQTISRYGDAMFDINVFDSYEAESASDDDDEYSEVDDRSIHEDIDEEIYSHADDMISYENRHFDSHQTYQDYDYLQGVPRHETERFYNDRYQEDQRPYHWSPTHRSPVMLPNGSLVVKSPLRPPNEMYTRPVSASPKSNQFSPAKSPVTADTRVVSRSPSRYDGLSIITTHQQSPKNISPSRVLHLTQHEMSRNTPPHTDRDMTRSPVYDKQDPRRLSRRVSRPPIRLSNTSASTHRITSTSPKQGSSDHRVTSGPTQPAMTQSGSYISSWFTKTKPSHRNKVSFGGVMVEESAGNKKNSKRISMGSVRRDKVKSAVAIQPLVQRHRQKRVETTATVAKATVSLNQSQRKNETTSPNLNSVLKPKVSINDSLTNYVYSLLPLLNLIIRKCIR